MTNVPANHSDTIAGLLAKQAPAIARAIGGLSPAEQQKRAERFTRVALTTIRNNEGLMKCNPQSVMGALMHCASFDMEPDARGLVWLVPYKGEAQFQLGYKGMIELAVRSGAVKSIRAEIVYESEVEAGMFEYHGGTEQTIRHDIDFLKPELRTGKVVAAYAVADMSNGTKALAVIDRAHIEKRRKASQSASSSYSPWQKWTEEMIKKTAIKELCRTLPQSIEKLHRAIALDNEYEARVIASKDAPGQSLDVETLNAKIMGEQKDEPICPITEAPVNVDDCVDCEEARSCASKAA
jgi:recombination protein RecT